MSLTPLRLRLLTMVAWWCSSLSVCLSSSSSCGSGCRPRSCHTMASLWCSRRYRLERSFTLTRRTTLLLRLKHRNMKHKTPPPLFWNSSSFSFYYHYCFFLLWADVHSHPLLPVLEARLCSVPFCRSWLFMMASCLCFRSISLARISSSIHTSERPVAAKVKGYGLLVSLDWWLSFTSSKVRRYYHWHVLLLEQRAKKAFLSHPEVSPPGQTLCLDWLHWLPAGPPFQSKESINKSILLIGQFRRNGSVGPQVLVCLQHLLVPSRRQHVAVSSHLSPSPPPEPCSLATALPQICSH